MNKLKQFIDAYDFHIVSAILLTVFCVLCCFFDPVEVIIDLFAVAGLIFVFVLALTK